ncbi:glycoside hydrolase family 5 protein [Guyanagaster necrorhizus]|uniref:Glycoside hydrolase family 5 protein n=1 Tax=Guyanagaster necrorhizus TaxID=856835 RepID=A0A9P7VRJ0_9AGAR|nr:glycoside hydrolase family 5 protein [Guyanagaster necrorhizus MCA 3950]KAG7445155.1 glycoside hydrolase family 5 protein [Guyanagaster necrorhizus MCA 3950]
MKNAQRSDLWPLKSRLLGLTCHSMYLPMYYIFYVSLFSFLSISVHARLPSKIYGVNLGSWLVLESWMLPAEWIRMGGQQCSDCSQCIATEFAFARAYPDTVDGIFNMHWSSWFNEDDVHDLMEVGINTVRIPLGYWIVEALVDRKTEFYPRGGIHQLKRGLRQLKDSGIIAILDHHALPGVQTPNQMFTGRCTSDVEFYTDYNYRRALVWTAVMTALSHLDPDFGSVVAIEAVNEPIMNATQTPGYGDFQKNFVQVVRAVELTLGIDVPWSGTKIAPTDTTNFTVALEESLPNFTPEVQSALLEAVPILVEVITELALDSMTRFSPHSSREPLYTSFMDINWQYDNPPNPSDAQIGPQIYDNHLYYSFGGVADPNEQAYLESICNLQRVQADAALGNSPLVFGEWGLSTQFNATDEFLYKWADAQKLAYTKGAGWIFWNFKVEISTLAGDLARQWSYLEGVKLGFLTRDPSKLNDTNVCDGYIQ